MNRADFSSASPGTLIKNLNGIVSFLPDSLPPELIWSNSLVAATTSATQAVAQLCGLGGRFPEPRRLIRLFMRREAELSSRIEQTHASVRTLLLFEQLERKPDEANDVREVQNNYQILVDGLEAIRERPITLALIRHLHKKLFDGIDTPHAKPGQWRSIPVFIGDNHQISDARFVPPPPLNVEDCMHDLEAFIRNTSELPTVVRAAIAHYQFETIHPFGDGNGRVGRALIMLMLVKDGLLSAPLLNPSAGLERRRRAYYDRLLDVSQRGEWASWIQFFCECVTEEAAHSVRILEQLDQLRTKFHQRARKAGLGGKVPDLIDEFCVNPAQTGASVAKVLDMTVTAAYRYLDRLENLKVVQEVTGKRRNRVYLASDVVNLFSTKR